MSVINKCVIGDCREVMRRLIAEGVRVQMCVTSPPYWGLRDYGTAQWEGGDDDCDHIEKQGRNDVTPERLAERAALYGTGQQAGSLVKPMQFKGSCPKCNARRIDRQLGLEATPAEYVANMVEVFGLVRDLLADDGVLFLNLGDSYWGGGRGGGSFESERPGWREVPCGTSGKALGDSLSRDCLCESLCGACRVAYRIGKSHSDGLLVPTQELSLSVTSPERTGSLSDRLPTLDSLTQEGRSEDAIPDSGHSTAPLSERPRAFSASMPYESSQQHRAGYRQSGQPSECQLCGHSLTDCVPASVDKARCSCDNAQRGSASRRSSMGVSDSAYQDSTIASLKPKDLVGIPWRVAFALQADGWYLRQDIIWAKPNPMPESVTDRCTKSHEYLFLLAKRERYYYDAAAIAEAFADERMGNPGSPSPKAAAIPGQSPHTIGSKVWDKGPENGGRNRRSVWTVPTAPYAEAHFATFPPALIEPCIMAGSRVGDIVLDPFFGSGTTGQVAQDLGRQWLGIELNPEYAKLQDRRTAQQAMVLA